MSTLAINAGEDLAPGAARAFARLAPGAPIVVMLHGFRYCPSDHASDPHRHILSDAPESGHWKAVSWPGQLGLDGKNGCGVGFGWPACGSIWQAYQRAEAAASDLARLLLQIRRSAPGHPVHLIAHSLGARVALLAMNQAPGLAHRALLIAPACFKREAEALAPRALRGTEVFSILSRENTAFDLMLRAVMPRQGATLGRGGPVDPRWLDLRLGAPHVMAALEDLGHAIAPPRARICHWSGYVRGGVWGIYRTLIHRPAELSMPQMRAKLDARPVRPTSADLAFGFQPDAPA